jgi:KDO2-lipid IV(A) lauroyltransferase
MTLWKKLRFTLEAAALRLLAWGIPKLDRQGCVHLANAIGELGALLDRRGRAVALANVECAFGDSLSPAQRESIVRESYRNFVRAMVDLFWAPRVTSEHIRTHGYEAVKERAARENRGILYISLHAGNWEWANLGCGLAGLPSIAVAEHFANPAVAPVITRLREATGQEIIPQENSMLRMMRAVKRGGRAGFLCDLGVHPTQAATVIRIFGLEISASIIHAVLAERANALLVVLHTTPQSDGTCDVRAEVIEMPAGLSSREIAQRCWDHFEPRLRREPGLWMWPYKHFRYRPKNTTRGYPFYANESGAFEKLRKKEGVGKMTQDGRQVDNHPLHGL